MGLSRLAKACRDCPFVETCQNKRMEASTQAGMSAAAPILRETMTVNAGDGTMVQVYKDDIKRELEKHLYEHLYSHLQLGG
jgi:hypothetical protein